MSHAASRAASHGAVLDAVLCVAHAAGALHTRGRAVPGEAFCSKHMPEALAASRARPVDPETRVTLPSTDGMTVRAGTKRRLSSRKRLANPYARQHQVPATLPPLDEVFARPSLPVHLDVGCARGLLVERLSQHEAGADWNFIGMELRPELAEAANVRRRARSAASADAGGAGGDATGSAAGDRAPLRNLHFISGNINVSVGSLIGGSAVVPPSVEGARAAGEAGDGPPVEERPRGLLRPVLRRVSILFPDPWRRAKHRRRRVVTPDFVDALAVATEPGCEIIISSDWLRLAKDMYRCFDDSNAFDVTVAPEPERKAAAERRAAAIAAATARRLEAAASGDTGDADDAEAEVYDSDSDIEGSAGGVREYHWLPASPLAIPTEREEVCERQWRPVYWAAFVRKGADGS